MKLDINDLAFLDEPDYTEYKILRTETPSIETKITLLGEDSGCVNGGCAAVLVYFGSLFLGFLHNIFGVIKFYNPLWIIVAPVIAWFSVVIGVFYWEKRKLRKQKKRLKSLEATYLPEEEKITNKIVTYVYSTRPVFGQEVLAHTKKDTVLGESEIKAFSENLKAYKEDIEYINRATLASIPSVSFARSYLTHFNMISEKADCLLETSKQNIFSKNETSEKIEIGAVHIQQDENRLVEEQYPKTEEKAIQDSPKEASEENGTHSFLSYAQNFNEPTTRLKIPSQIPTPISQPIQSDEIPQNPVAKITAEVAKSKAEEGNENEIVKTNPNPQLQLDFGSNEGLILTETAPVKAKKSASHEITVKARIFDWSKINISKMATGSLGEELVLKFEEERLATLGLGKLVASIEHSSKVRGDGLGYDILSFDETRNSVFIEVKATTGGFWNGIVFTKNEIEFMNSCGKAYRLYRIFEINKAAKTGKICTFSGSKAVNEFFNFVPQSFSAKPK